jgi:hypothetical protein
VAKRIDPNSLTARPKFREGLLEVVTGRQNQACYSSLTGNDALRAIAIERRVSHDPLGVILV